LRTCDGLWVSHDKWVNGLRVFPNNIANEVAQLPGHQVFGRVADIVGLMIEIGGLQGSLSIGDHVRVDGRKGNEVLCEVIGFKGGRAMVMPFGPLEGVGLGCNAELASTQPSIYPDESWLGRVVNAFGKDVDGLGALSAGERGYAIHASPPPAHNRRRVGGKVDLGVRAMNTFLTCCRGQRMGIFAGSGVGKSTLLSMMARNTDAEVSVVGLIGERGREAKEFIEDYLGEEGMKRTVVIVATSDEPPLVRRQAAYTTLAIAEYFRDRGRNVLCMMDSVTRFAMAQREISLSAGEPPASKGYTPSVFAELPKLLERAGPGSGDQGDITGLFTVLVEGDDHNEPVADAVRGILDGHVVLERQIAERNRFPAINILRSVSRTMPGCNTPAQNAAVARARRLLATYDDMAELIRLGAYRKGSDAEVDEAILYYPQLEAFLGQQINDVTRLDDGYAALYEILGMNGNAAPAAETDGT
jgi:flagellum-specific ATP synthase